jgi:predicted NUDIX family NTP pyrophosphohydrolase
MNSNCAAAKPPSTLILHPSAFILSASMIQSSGTLLYRRQAVGTGAPPTLEVLLIHPSGNYNKHKPWGIPKGLPDEGESLEEAARRETVEEAGVVPGELTPLGSITYRKSRKVIHCFAGPAPADAVAKCASWEIDGCEFLPLDEARRRIHPDQAPFLDRLEELLKATDAGGQ